MNSVRISLMLILVSLLYCKASLGQEVTGCFPVSQRTTEVMCWVLSNAPIGQLSKTPVYWYLETYEKRAAAETDKGPHGTVVESLGKIWLMTIDEPGRKPTPNLLNSSRLRFFLRGCAIGHFEGQSRRGHELGAGQFGVTT